MKTKRLNSKELDKLKTIVFEKSGFFLPQRLLEQAFTRKSFTVQNGGENNEILELLGDGILGYYVLKAISENFGAKNGNCEFTIRATEGTLSNIKSQIVNNETLAKIIDQWQIGDYLLVGKCDKDNQIDIMKYGIDFASEQCQELMPELFDDILIKGE